MDSRPALQNQANAAQTIALDDVLVQTRAVYQVTDDAVAQHRPAWIPCKAGCSFCCWTMNSMVTWLEAATIFHQVKTWSAEQKRALIERATNERALLLADPDIGKFAEGVEIKPEELTNLNAAFRRYVRPCAFLNRADGTCSIYDERPMACRMFGHVSVQSANAEPAGYFCDVVEKDFDAQVEKIKTGAAKDDTLNLLDATPFFKVVNRMAGAPHVFALPLSFWVWEVANGTEWNIDYPERLFERFLGWFHPLELRLREGAALETENASTQNDVNAASEG